MRFGSAYDCIKFTVKITFNEPDGQRVTIGRDWRISLNLFGYIRSMDSQTAAPFTLKSACIQRCRQPCAAGWPMMRWPERADRLVADE